VTGVLKGISGFLSGFDAISTTAERMQGSTAGFTARYDVAIIICTVLYIVVALVLTGMVNYSELNVGDPLAFVFHKLDLKWMSVLLQ
jgi:amino acid transporter